MKRIIEGAFEKWADDPHRKPLLVWGARQIGKTYAVRDWAPRRFKHLVEVNFQEKPSWKKAFSGDLDPDTILRNIEIALERPLLRDGSDILFFDEIQDCPEALTSLKYFCEKSPQIPAGKVEIIHMYPMSFGDFLYPTFLGKRRQPP